MNRRYELPLALFCGIGVSVFAGHSGEAPHPAETPPEVMPGSCLGQMTPYRCEAISRPKLRSAQCTGPDPLTTTTGN